MRDFERELRALPVQWPETPDLAVSVRPRLEPRPARRRVPSRRRIAAVTVALLLGGVAAVEPARSAVLELLGLKSVRIERREPTATPAPAGADLDLGRPVTQAEAERRAVGFEPRPPATLGSPDGLFLSETGGVTYVYGERPDVIVMELAATVTPFIEKSVGSAAGLERFRIDGDPAYFITGAHGVAISEPGGGARFDDQRLAGNTLLVERADGLLIRIEGDLSRGAATAIARSIPR